MTTPADATSAIIDNRDRCVGDFLRSSIEVGSNLSIVSAYFSIYAYQALRETLEAAGQIRFLYGDPHGVAAPDPGGSPPRSFRLTEDGGLGLGQTLTQKALASACAAWIKRKVDIRSVKRAGFLHGKLYHSANPDGTAAVVGSSNLTRRGLGFGATPNIELNLEVRDTAERQHLRDWFDALWNDTDLSRDVKAEVLTALERLGRAYAPEFVYYKTLFHVFADWIDRQREQQDRLQAIHLHDTAIWQKLYEFQRDGVVNAINRLLKHNGCIVADSVGLGKTWTALTDPLSNNTIRVRASGSYECTGFSRYPDVQLGPDQARALFDRPLLQYQDAIAVALD